MMENAAAGPRSNCPTAFCVRYCDRKVVALPAAAGEHEGLGIDHEAVHEAQQHRDHQDAAHLGQLDVPEHRQARGAVDAGGLVVGIGNRAQPRIAQQRDQRRPVPHVHDQHRDPGVHVAAGVVVVHPSQDSVAPSRPMSVRPNTCQMVPTTFQGISSDSAMTTSTADARQPEAGMDSASRMPSGISMASTASEKPISQQRAMQFLVLQHGGEPFGAHEHAALRRDDVLHRIVDDGHQRQDGRERHAQHHGQDQEPGPVIDRFHRISSSSR